MEFIDTKKVKELWKKEDKKLKKPDVFFAVHNKNAYYVFRDDSFIIFMIPSKCNVTYALPKKYTVTKKDKNGEKYYDIKSIENASVVSCIGTKNDYEKFIIEKIVVDPNC
jgi:hypothetical protein